jgi:type IV pilus assembly protein PilX
MTKPNPSLRPQRGSALIVVLLLLLVTMLMAVASLRTANVEERMAGNQRDRQVAFQAAEAALRDGEQTIATGAAPFKPLRPGQFTAACPSGLCRSAPGAPLWTAFSSSDWTSSKTFAYGSATSATALAGVTATPRFVIEYQGTLQPIEPGKPCVAMFLVTARATGASAASEVILQSVYRHRVGECYAAI